jgi:hypothetical protein
MCLLCNVMRKNMRKIFFASLTKGVVSRSRDPDRNPDVHQNVTDPQHWKKCKKVGKQDNFGYSGDLVGLLRIFCVVFCRFE